MVYVWCLKQNVWNSWASNWLECWSNGSKMIMWIWNYFICWRIRWAHNWLVWLDGISFINPIERSFSQGNLLTLCSVLSSIDFWRFFSRITGLDPAIPSLFEPVKFVPLNSKDAVFVDVIHTDAGLYGSTGSSGTVDFWPNGGTTLQPGCPKRYYIPLTANGISVFLMYACLLLMSV